MIEELAPVRTTSLDRARVPPRMRTDAKRVQIELLVVGTDSFDAPGALRRVRSGAPDS